MSNRVVDLVARISADVAGDVDGAFDRVGAGAARMADDVGDAGARATGHLDKLGGAAEGLDDKFGRAAGAAGALSSGADLIGNEKASVALQAIGLATDFFSGVGQLGILVFEALSVSEVENEAATVSNTIATKAAAGASKAWAIAQGALNAVMDANPIALVVLAVVALVAGFIIAYKHSETFRAIVQAAMRGASNAVHLVVDAVGDVVGWVIDLGGHFTAVGDVVHAFVFVAKAEIGAVVDVIKFVADKVGDLGHVFGQLKDDTVHVAETIRDKVGSALHAVLHPIETVKNTFQDIFDLIGRIIDAISKIHVPHVDLNPFGRTTTDPGPGRHPDPPTSSSGGVTVSVDMPITITITTDDDPQAIADGLVTALTQQADRLGRTVADLIGSAGVVAA